MQSLWLRKVRAVVLSTILALAVTGSFAPRPAAAVTVEVGGFIYDLTVLTPGLSFNEANAAVDLTAAPWWGDRFLTRDIANAYALVASPLAAPVRFAFSSPIGFLVASYEAASGVVDLQLGFAATTGGNAWVTGTRRQIPEIDGALVPRLALIVLAAYLVVLNIRRHRGALGLAAVRLPVGPRAKAKHRDRDQEIGHGMGHDHV